MNYGKITLNSRKILGIKKKRGGDYNQLFRLFLDICNFQLSCSNFNVSYALFIKIILVCREKHFIV